MEKELCMWRSEATQWQQRLTAAQQKSHEVDAERALRGVDAEIASKQESIALLKRRMIENEAKLADLLKVVTGEM